MKQSLLVYTNFKNIAKNFLPQNRHRLSIFPTLKDPHRQVVAFVEVRPKNNYLDLIEQTLCLQNCHQQTEKKIFFREMLQHLYYTTLFLFFEKFVKLP